MKWKRGQNLSVVAVKEKSRAKEGGACRVALSRCGVDAQPELWSSTVYCNTGRRKNVTRIKQCESFFNIFSGPMLSGTGANEHDDHEEVRSGQRGQSGACITPDCGLRSSSTKSTPTLRSA